MRCRLLRPGESASGSFNLAANEYQLICSIEGRLAEGM